jgi:DegV family protein with EDD domain
MQSYCLLTGSTADLPGTFYAENDITIMPYPVVIDDREFANDPLSHFDDRGFYNAMRGGSLPTTSNLNPLQIGQAVKDCFERGKDVLYIVFSHGLSSTFDVAVAVQRALAAQYPKRRLVLVDSLCASLGMGILVEMAQRYWREGLSIDETAQRLNEHKRYIEHYITVSDLDHLFRGGRISRTAAMVGKLAMIKPILTIGLDGRLAQREKVNGRKKSIRTLARRCAEASPDLATFETIYVVHGDCPDDAQSLRDAVREETGAEKIEIRMLGPVIGAHTGPDMLAVTFLGKRGRTV